MHAFFCCQEKECENSGYSKSTYLPNPYSRYTSERRYANSSPFPKRELPYEVTSSPMQHSSSTYCCTSLKRLPGVWAPRKYHISFATSGHATSALSKATSNNCRRIPLDRDMVLFISPMFYLIVHSIPYTPQQPAAKGILPNTHIDWG